MKAYKWAWIYGLLTVVLLYFMEQRWQLSYLTKTLIKLPLFTIIPWMLMKGLVKNTKGKHFKMHALKIVLLGMLTVILGVTIAYLVAKSWINIEVIRADILSRMHISTGQLLGAALYTTFINSFIEEYFFRKFLFLGSLSKGKRKTGYLMSSLLFSVYHVTIFLQWFNLPIMLLATSGLFIGGLIFAWFADKSESIIGSWMVHIAADAVIMVIGILVLGLYA